MALGAGPTTPNGRTPLEILIVLGSLALALGLSLNARRRRSFAGALPLVLYLLLQAAWALVLAGQSFNTAFDPRALGVLADYAAMLAPLFLLGATIVYTRSGRRAWLLLGAPILLAAAAVGLDARLFGSRGLALTLNGNVVSEDGLRLAARVATWGSALLIAFILAWTIRVGSSSPLHRNRLRYWLLALFMVAVGMTLTLTLAEAMLPTLTGGGVILLGSGLAVISWGFYYLPDIRVGLRRALSTIILTIVTFAIYLLGLRLTNLILPANTEQEALIGAVLVASVLAVAYGPLRQGVQFLTQRLLGGGTVDYAAALKAYNQRITHVLDLEPLAQMAVETARTTLGATRGALFLVKNNDDDSLTLDAIGGVEYNATDVPAGEQLACPAASPINQRWRAGGALLQYDIDVLPAFKAVRADERATLARWKMEVFFPVRTMGQLVGVLGVGSKKSGDPFFDSDMSYLATLADGTAVALQNARLFSELRVANRQTEELNRDLEQANEQLKELDRLKSAFIGVITHELRSPFAALDFSMQLIQRYGLDNLLPEQREQLEQLGEGLKRAQVMINNLITFASFLSKQGQLRTAPVSLRQLANETLATLEPLARSRQVKLTLDCGAIPIIMGDRDRLGEALYHLAQNGIKFNRPGGTVTIRCQSAPHDVIVEVEDTGVGISPEKLPEMWQDFTQVADPLKRGVEGLGLGLPLVRYVVKAHGGQVWARSELGQGSVFGFRIPKEARVAE
jgi:signal transduction histidine kinase